MLADYENTLNHANSSEIVSLRKATRESYIYHFEHKAALRRNIKKTLKTERETKVEQAVPECTTITCGMETLTRRFLLEQAREPF